MTVYSGPIRIRASLQTISKPRSGPCEPRIIKAALSKNVKRTRPGATDISVDLLDRRMEVWSQNHQEGAVRTSIIPVFIIAATLGASREQQTPVQQRMFVQAEASALEAGRAQAPEPAANAFIHQIDHIVIDSDSPEALFHLFLEKLELPLGWPFRSYGTFSSGGVGFGNVILEFIHMPDLHPGVAGVAFEPSSIEEALSGLDARNVKHGPAEPVYQPDTSGGKRLGWTTVDLLLPVDGFFLCKYNTPVIPRRVRISQELQARKGGPLGIASVVEVVVGVRDLPAAQVKFRNLLGPPRQGEPSVWAVGDGPAVRLVADKQDRLAIVKVKVHSLERARTYLKAENMLGDSRGKELSLNIVNSGETSIRLVE